MKYYPINEDLARMAKEMNSYYDYIPGSATQAYQRAVDWAAEIAEFQKQRVDPIHHEKIDRLLDTYARKLAENINQSNSISTRVPSILISGGGNFPVRKKEKQNRAAAANMEEWRQIRGLLDKIKGTGLGGISADEPDAVDKLKAKLERLEAFQDKIKAEMARSWCVPPKPYESFTLSNNSASIHQVVDFCKLVRQCFPDSAADSPAEAQQAAEPVQMFLTDGKRTADQMVLTAAGFVIETEVSQKIRDKGENLMTRLAHYRNSVAEDETL